jgi:hypothetical protein
MTPETIAAEILAKLKLPDDLKGRFVNLVGFPDEASCGGFYPGRSLADHERACRLVSLAVAKRGGSTCRTIKALLSSDNASGPEGYAKIADRHNYLVPRPGSVTAWRGYDPATSTAR